MVFPLPLSLSKSCCFLWLNPYLLSSGLLSSLLMLMSCRLPVALPFCVFSLFKLTHSTAAFSHLTALSRHLPHAFIGAASLQICYFVVAWAFYSPSFWHSKEWHQDGCPRSLCFCLRHTHMSGANLNSTKYKNPSRTSIQRLTVHEILQTVFLPVTCVYCDFNVCTGKCSILGTQIMMQHSLWCLT